MDKKRGTQTIIIAILAVAILFMSVGFAIYAQNLDINGTVTVKASKWSIHFVNNTYTETGNVTATAHTLTDTVATYTATLTKPGDTYSFTVDITNDGTFDANLDSLTLSTLTEAQKKYLTYTVKYDGVSYTSTSDIDKVLSANSTKTVEVVVSYIQPSTSDELPQEDVTVTLTASFAYSQA